MKNPSLVVGLGFLMAAAASAQKVASPEVLDAAGLQRATAQELVLPAETGHPFEVEVRLHGGLYNLVLEPHSVRTPGYRVLVQAADGRTTAVEPAPEATYRGHVEGADDSLVAASLLDGQLHAVLRLAEDLPLLGVQPVSALGVAGERTEHVVYDASDLLPQDVFCGTDLLDVDVHPQASGGSPGAVAGGLTECEIACDADFEFYQQNGSSVSATEQDIAHVINGVAAIYLADVGMGFKITTILVRTSSSDPYSTSNPGSLLNQFTNHWSSSQQGVQRDIAHLFTGKNLNGSTIGIAWLNSVCGNNNGYGLSQSRYSGNLTNRVALTAHEIGHNFAAGHCNGAGGCAIMCSGLGGCSGNVTSFYNGSKNTISNKIASSGCIGPASPDDPPSLSGVQPGVIAAMNGGDLTITGSNFGEVQEVRVGSSVMPLGKVQTGFSAITVLDPLLEDAGSNEVVVTTSAGAGGGAFLTVLESTAIDVDPPALVVPGFELEIPWSGGAGNFYSLNWSLDPTTVPVSGFDLLATPNVGVSGTFGTAGTASLQLGGVGSFGFLNLYVQVLVFDGPSFLGASEVKGVLFL